MSKDLALDSIAQADIDLLLQYGDQLVASDKQKINEALHAVVEQALTEKGYKHK